tara:strand:- start:4568 stop:4930 length:363 start_codon:yes stop_codon:yes gene_type:complete
MTCTEKIKKVYSFFQDWSASGDQLIMNKFQNQILSENRYALNLERKNKAIRNQIIIWICFGCLFYDYVYNVGIEYIVAVVIYLLLLFIALMFFYIKKQKYHNGAFNCIIFLAHFRIILAV